MVWSTKEQTAGSSEVIASTQVVVLHGWGEEQEGFAHRPENQLRLLLSAATTDTHVFWWDQ